MEREFFADEQTEKDLKLRDEGKIRFSQPEKKIILYDLDSIHAYLNHHAKSTF